MHMHGGHQPMEITRATRYIMFYGALYSNTIKVSGFVYFT